MTNEPIEAIVAQLHEAIAIADRTIEEAQADRARLVAALDALWRPATPAPTVSTPAAPAPKTPKVTKARKAPTGRPGRKPTPDCGAIAEWINRTRRDGTYSQAGLAAAFGVPETTSRNYVTKCGKLGLLDANGPATNEPIARAPFDPDKARAAAADTAWPIEGGGRIHGADGYEPHTPRPEPQAPATVQFGVDDAIATLEAAS